MRFVIVLAVVLAPFAARADGDAVALLPFDADKRLELYGQPVASEVAKALAGEHIEVVVVTAKDSMPARAKLIVDGTITAGKGDAVHLTARVRDRTGTTVAKVAADAAVLTSIDAAEASLAKDVLRAVQDQLAKKTAPPAAPLEPTKPSEPKPPPAPATHSIIIAVGPGPLPELGPAATAWAQQHHRTVAGSGDADATVALDPISYDVEPGPVPMARAHVRVRISDRTKTLKFDRVVVTDTVVGEKNLDKTQLAARVAREVLAIVEPHMRRAIDAWK